MGTVPAERRGRPCLVVRYRAQQVRRMRLFHAMIRLVVACGSGGTARICGGAVTAPAALRIFSVFLPEKPGPARLAVEDFAWSGSASEGREMEPSLRQ